MKTDSSLARWADFPGTYSDPTAPLYFALETVHEYNGAARRKYALVTLKDAGGHERVAFVYSPLGYLLTNGQIQKRLPLKFGVVAGDLLETGEKTMVEVYGGIIDPAILVPANQINLHQSCRMHTYLNRFLHTHQGHPSRMLLDGIIFHEFLNFCYEDVDETTRVPPLAVIKRDLVKPAIWRALLLNWKILVVFGIGEEEYFRWFVDKWGDQEARFFHDHVRKLQRELVLEDEGFAIQTEFSLQSLRVGLQGRSDRLIWHHERTTPAGRPRVDIVETKLGKGSTSSIQGALAQLHAYGLMFLAERAATLGAFLIEYPNREADERFECNAVDPGAFFATLNARNGIYAIQFGHRPWAGPYEYVGFCARCWNRDACSFYCYVDLGTRKCPDCKNPCPYPQRFAEGEARRLFQRAKAHYKFFFALLNWAAYETLDLRRELILPVETREKRGNAIGHLTFHEAREPGGKYLYAFTRPEDQPIAGTRLREGDLVIFAEHDEPAIHGTGTFCRVEKINEHAVTISSRKALPAFQGGDRPRTPFRLDMTSVDIVTSREKEALDQFFRLSFHPKRKRLAKIRNTFLFLTPPRTQRPGNPLQFTAVTEFDEVQRDAVVRAVEARDFFGIQGPPGTGKTTVIAEIVYHLVERTRAASGPASSAASGQTSREKSDRIFFGKSIENLRAYRPPKIPVLVTAYTHRAVDNIVKKLVEAYPTIKVARVGAAASVQEPVVRPYCLEELCRTSRITRAGVHLHGHSGDTARVVLEAVDVVATTTTHLGSTVLVPFQFRSVIVDEAGQISEPSTLIAACKADTTILVGDHKQLPAVNVETRPSREFFQRHETDLRALALTPRDSLVTSLLERCARNFHDSEHVLMLRYQYRMNAVIAAFASENFYGGELRSGRIGGRDVGTQTFADFCADVGLGEFDYADPVGRYFHPQRPFVFLDTRDTAWYDSGVEVGGELESKYNAGEVRVVTRVVVGLLAQVARQADPLALLKRVVDRVGIIAAYRAQVLEIRRSVEQVLPRLFPEVAPAPLTRIFEGFLIDTVDRFQGKERDVILISLVDSNEEHQLNRILAETRRLNVSITRAKRKVILTGHSPTLTRPGKRDDDQATAAKQLFSALVAHARAHDGYFVVTP